MPTIEEMLDPAVVEYLRQKHGAALGLPEPSVDATPPMDAPPAPTPGPDIGGVPPPSPGSGTPSIGDLVTEAQRQDLRANLFRRLGDAGRQIGSAFGGVPFKPSDQTSDYMRQLQERVGAESAATNQAMKRRLEEAQAKQAEAHAKWWEQGGRPGANKITVNDGNRADVVRILSRIDPKTDYASMTNPGLEVAFNTKAQLASANTNEAKAGLAQAAGERAAARGKESSERHGAKLIADLKKDLDPNAARAGVFGKYQEQVFQADRLLQLTASGYNLDNRQINEFAIGLNKLLSGSSAPAQKQVEHLIPRTYWSDAARLKEYILNNPQGIRADEFVRRMEDTIKRERNVAADNIRKTQIQRLPAHKTAFQSHPDEAKAVLQAFGIDPEGLDDNLRPKEAKTPGTSPGQPKATHRFNPATGQIEAIGE